jgi:hypothetical protein
MRTDSFFCFAAGAPRLTNRSQLGDKRWSIRCCLGNVRKEYLADGPECFCSDIEATCALKLGNLSAPSPKDIHKFSADDSPSTASVVEVGDSPADGVGSIGIAEATASSTATPQGISGPVPFGFTEGQGYMELMKIARIAKPVFGLIVLDGPVGHVKVKIAVCFIRTIYETHHSIEDDVIIF